MTWVFDTTTQLSMLCWYCLFFFFFQAEDGIRDWSVTGVQTCALPIWPWPHRAAARAGDGSVLAGARRAERRRQRPRPADRRGAGGGLRGPPRADAERRSEERRGGEEGRSRGGPYH